MKKKKYKIIAKGKKANEEIIAILDDEGYIHKVASGWYDHKKGIYRLYPTNHPRYQSISTKMNVDLNEVQLM